MRDVLFACVTYYFQTSLLVVLVSLLCIPLNQLCFHSLLSGGFARSSSGRCELEDKGEGATSTGLVRLHEWQCESLAV